MRTIFEMNSLTNNHNDAMLKYDLVGLLPVPPTGDVTCAKCLGCLSFLAGTLLKHQRKIKYFWKKMKVLS